MQAFELWKEVLHQKRHRVQLCRRVGRLLMHSKTAAAWRTWVWYLKFSRLQEWRQCEANKQMPDAGVGTLALTEVSGYRQQIVGSIIRLLRGFSEAVGDMTGGADAPSTGASKVPTPPLGASRLHWAAPPAHLPLPLIRSPAHPATLSSACM